MIPNLLAWAAPKHRPKLGLTPRPLARSLWYGLLLSPVASVLVALTQITSAQALEVPPHTSLIVDQAGVFSPEEANSLRTSLTEFQQRVGPQLQALIIPSLEGDTIENFSIHVADKWKVGDAKRDDGVILIVALKDRALRIEVGQGLEGQLPDVLAGRIIRDTITPRFREGQMAAGVVAGLQEIAHYSGGELANVPAYAAPNRSGQQGSGRGSIGHLFWLFILFFLILPRIFRGRQSTVGGLATGFILGRSGRSSGGGIFGGGGGGGFGGGGGGGFSGGGSSGNW